MMTEDLYDNHDIEWRRCLSDPKRAAIAESWLRTDTVDAWRHDRMRKTLRPLLQSHPGWHWLTVGDGRFGTDAWFLMQQGVRVHASDYTSPLLEQAASRGLIGDYSAENAEALSFPDESFDFVLCKESFHHFPRPWLALYEMWRASRVGVALIEPLDPVCTGLNLPLLTFRRAIRSLGPRARARNAHTFEPVGNYVYSISLRECEKFLLGMHCRWLTWHPICDHYEQGVEFCPLEGGSDEQQALRHRTFTSIRRQERRLRLGLAAPSLVSVLLFKQEPDPADLVSLTATGWRYRTLPKNPYR
jgi:SAM-dependent methyltransferase